MGCGCAQVEAPPGGPEEFPPPVLLSVRPDSFSVLADRRRPVVFRFDQTLSEEGVEEAVSVSPRTSPFRVDQGGSEVRIFLEDGWEPGIIYQVALAPTIRTRWNESPDQETRLIFSTGPEIPATEVAGTVTDRITGRAARELRVEAILTPDSLVYATLTDTVGGFSLGSIPEGSYRLRAFEDLDGSRSLDPFEKRDTARTEVREGEPVRVSLRVLEPDTTPPALISAEYRDGLVLVEFDDYLDPDLELSSGQVTLASPAGAPLAVTSVSVGEGAVADTPVAVPDTVAAPPREELLPSRLVTIVPERELPPGEGYKVSVRDVRNLNALSGGGEAGFAVPEPPDRDETNGSDQPSDDS